MVGAGESLLRAVLFCDTDSTTHTTPSAALHQIIDDASAEVLDSNGAGVVAGFATIGSAIDAGRAITTADPAMRVGISIGEVLAEADAWIGSAVIEAARLQQRAEPGQVLISAIAAEIATDADRTPFHTHGTHELKGLGEPVEVLEVVGGAPWTAPLRVVLAVDMVASTELLARVGDAESLRLRRCFEQTIDKACTKHGGVLVDQRGDGVLLDFDTVSSAALAASGVVYDIRRQALRADTDSRFAVRLGLACQPGDRAAVLAETLMASAEPNQVVADAASPRLARDRGISFARADERWLVGTESVGLPVPRALRIDGELVGRATELGHLERAWKTASSGTLTMLEITGDPGMGKTRLVSEFACMAAAAGAAVLYGGCDPELDIPYGALVDALIHAADLNAEFETIVGSHQTRGTGAVGDVAVGDGTVSESDRDHVFQNYADIFAGLAACRPLVLVIDDLHWANASTLLVLRHMVSAIPTSRLLVIGTYRPLEIERGHPLHDFHAELLPLGAVPHRLDLDRLAVADVVEMMERQVGAGADAAAKALAARVHRETSGTPFYVRELLRSLAEAGAMAVDAGVVTTTSAIDALPIPDSVRGVVAGRLNQLDSDVHRLLSLGAVAGPQFSLDVACRALGRPFDDVVTMAESAEHVSLVTEGDRPRTYAFSHAIVRSALLDDLSATRLAAAHESIAIALTELPGDHTDALANHWSQAAGPYADEQALVYIERAAERDAGALAWEAAASRYRLLLDRLDTNPAAVDERLTETWLGLGAAMRAVGDAGYLDAVIEAGRCARRIERADLLARAAIGSMKPGAWFANANETNDAIVGFCEDALDGLADDDPARVQVLAIMATSLAFESDRGRRVDLVGEAVDLARSHGDPSVLASALIAEHLALWDPTTLDRRVEIAEELGRIARRRDLPEVEFLAGFFRASALLETRQVDQTRTQLEQLAPLIERTGNFWFYFLVERMRIGLDIAQDLPDTAASVDALFEESAASQADAAGTWAAQHGGLAIHAGRMGNMADSLQSAAEGRRGQGIWSNALVIALLERDDRDAAVERAAELQKPNLDFMWLVSMQMRAEVGYGLGDKELCLDAIEELLPFRDRLGVIASGTLSYGLVSTSIGEAALGAGDFDLAVDVLTQAVRDAHDMHAPFFEQKSAALLTEARAKQAQRLDDR